MKSTRVLWIINIIIHIGYAFAATKLDPFLRMDPLYGDAQHFHDVARILASGGGFDLEIMRGPLFPLVSAGVYWLFGPNPLFIRLMNAVFMIAGSVFLYLFTKKHFSDKVAWWTLLLFCLHPLLLHISGWLYSEPLMIMLVYASFLVYHYVIKTSYNYKWVLLLGVLMGLIALTRSMGLSICVLMVQWLLFDAPWGRKIAVFAISVFACAIVIAPWTYRNYLKYDSFVPVAHAGYEIFRSNNSISDGRGSDNAFSIIYEMPDGTITTVNEILSGKPEIEKQKIMMTLGTSWIMTHPKEFLALAPLKLHEAFTPISYKPNTEKKFPRKQWFFIVGDIGMSVIWLLTIFGYVKARSYWRETMPHVLLFLAILISIVLFHGSSRFVLPLAPAMCMYMAIGIVSLKREKISREELIHEPELPGCVEDSNEFIPNVAVVSVVPDKSENYETSGSVDKSSEIKNYPS